MSIFMFMSLPQQIRFKQSNIGEKRKRIDFLILKKIE